MKVIDGDSHFIEPMEPTCALILLSCSNRKRTDGQPLRQLNAHSISEFLTKPEQQVLFQRRNEIRHMLDLGRCREYCEGLPHLGGIL